MGVIGAAVRLIARLRKALRRRDTIFPLPSPTPRRGDRPVALPPSKCHPNRNETEESRCRHDSSLIAPPLIPAKAVTHSQPTSGCALDSNPVSGEVLMSIEAVIASSLQGHRCVDLEDRLRNGVIDLDRPNLHIANPFLHCSEFPFIFLGNLPPAQFLTMP